jgi:hypothetical protein
VFIASLPAPTTKGDLSCSGTLPVPRDLFVERQMNACALVAADTPLQRKRPASQPAFFASDDEVR